MGMGIKSISSAFHVSRNTVRKYVRRYQESGLTLEQLTAMSEEKLQEMFLDDCNRSHKPTPRKEALEALVPDYVKRLSRKGVTVKSLHEEYLREHPDGYLYSNFKRAIRQYKYQVRPVGHVVHHNIAPPKMNGRTILTMFPSMVFCSIGAKVIVSLNFEL